MAVGEEAEVADLGKTMGKDMEEEPPDEFVCIESLETYMIVLFAVSPFKSDLPILKCHQTVVGNRDAVRIASQVIEDLGGSTKGRAPGRSAPWPISVSMAVT
jgi:hypothetical protein